jgi:hypothetical protein
MIDPHASPNGAITRLQIQDLPADWALFEQNDAP